MINIQIKIWLRLLEDGTYRMVTNPDMVEPGDIETLIPYSFDGVL